MQLLFLIERCKNGGNILLLIKRYKCYIYSLRKKYTKEVLPVNSHNLWHQLFKVTSFFDGKSKLPIYKPNKK